MDDSVKIECDGVYLRVSKSGHSIMGWTDSLNHPAFNRPQKPVWPTEERVKEFVDALCYRSASSDHPTSEH